MTITTAEHVEPRHTWRLVAIREVLVKLTDKTFVISTLGTVALITALSVAQALLSARTETFTVVATPAATSMAGAVRDSAQRLDDKVIVRPTAVPDDAAARAAVMSGEADAWLGHTGDTWVLTTKSDTNDSLESVVRQVIRTQALQQNAARAEVSVADLERGSTVTTTLLEGDAQRAGLGKLVGGAFAFLFYMASLIFGVTLASSVLEEKQSRIVEIIATAIPLRQLLAGKVVGNTAIAAGQLVLYLVVGLIGLSFTDYGSLVPSLTSATLWFVVFFLAGFVMLACLWAVAGSLASRQEDLQATSGPVTLTVMAVTFGSLFFEGRWQVIASFVPPFSAVVMPIRLVQHAVPWWQVVLALAGLLLAAAGTIRLGERIYRRSLLQTGSRVGLRQAWRADT